MILVRLGVRGKIPRTATPTAAPCAGAHCKLGRSQPLEHCRRGGAHHVLPSAWREERVAPAAAVRLREGRGGCILARPEAHVPQRMQPRHCGLKLANVGLPRLTDVLKFERSDAPLAQRSAHPLQDEAIPALGVNRHEVRPAQLWPRRQPSVDARRVAWDAVRRACMRRPNVLLSWLNAMVRPGDTGPVRTRVKRATPSIQRS